MQIDDALEQWLLASESEGLRPATLVTYRWHTKIATNAIIALGASSLEEITPFLIRRWLVDYQSNHAAASVHSTFKSLRVFLRWCRREGILKGDPLANVRSPKEPQSTKDTYTMGEMKAIFAALKPNRSPLGLRDSAIVAVLADTGLRANELCHLKLSDLAADELIVRFTKNHRERPAFLGRHSIRCLIRYMTQGRPKLKPKEDWMFVSNVGAQLNSNAIGLVLSRLSEKVGFPVGAHKFRHTWATTVTRSGADTITLRDLAGWTTTRMAEKYVHLTASDLRKAHQKARPLDGLW